MGVDVVITVAVLSQSQVKVNVLENFVRFHDMRCFRRQINPFVNDASDLSFGGIFGAAKDLHCLCVEHLKHEFSRQSFVCQPNRLFRNDNVSLWRNDVADLKKKHVHLVSKTEIKFEFGRQVCNRIGLPQTYASI